jgi:RNA polymerase sigma factor (sigma-70 family)
MTPPSVTLLRTQTDERLVTLARAGHERAFEAIVERYRRSLLRYGRRYLPEARAEDALQQALMSAWTALQRGDEVRELRPWLHRIVHNTSLNALRASGYDYEQLHDTLQGAGGPAELAERSAVVRSTLAGLAALPERQRDALLRIAVEGRTQDEVAEELGLSQGAVRQLVHRARSSLRAAATALTPLPLAGWLAAGGERADVAARVGELVAGAGGGATLAKAGAVAVLAGGAVSGPTLVQHVQHARPATARSATVSATPAHARAAATPDDDGTADRSSGNLATTPIAADRVRTTSRRRSGSGPSGRSGKHGGSGKDHSGPSGRGGDDDKPSGSSPRSGDVDDAGSGSGSDGGGDHGGSGDDERTGSVSDDEAAETGSGSGSGEHDQPEAPDAEGGDTEHSDASHEQSGSGGSDDSGHGSDD